MCGISGFISPDWPACGRAIIDNMTLLLRHRGPDAGGVFTDAEAGVALGHRRLAILDLSERGAQPMRSGCGRYIITFNGEIYNHLALRQELEQAAPIAWRGISDTETLLEAFSAWGVQRTLQKSVGMFALGLWDRAERRLTLARDRFGEKPLYWGWAGDRERRTFLFGSELKALRAWPGFDNAISLGAVELFMRYCYVPAPHCIYENVFKLEPGMTLTLDQAAFAREQPRIEPYWRFEDAALAGVAEPILDEREALECTEKALRDAVRLQLMAEVPLGVFLSGGIDSSTIVALMQQESSRPVKSFTVGFNEDGFDEAPHAGAVARHIGTDHHEIYVSPAETQAVIPELPTNYDEPFADSSQIPTSIICKIARRSVTVALSGDAGDELFGGYNRYFLAPVFWRLAGRVPAALRVLAANGVLCLSIEDWNRVGRWPLLSRRVAMLGDKAHKLAAYLRSVNSIDDLYRRMVSQWPRGEAPVLAAAPLSTRLDMIESEGRFTEPALRMMFLDTLTYLPDDILTKLDRAAMATALETRIPMLDHRVVEVAWRLPWSMKFRGGRRKWALRQILYKYVPERLVERPKAGFGIPIGLWLRGPLRDWAETLLAEGKMDSEGYLDASRVRRLWRDHLDGKQDWTVPLWNVLMYQAWLEAQ
jgi:asparagine synthase (glutamine-hydrolysing)